VPESLTEPIDCVVQPLRPYRSAALFLCDLCPLQRILKVNLSSEIPGSKEGSHAKDQYRPEILPNPRVLEALHRCSTQRTTGQARQAKGEFVFHRHENEDEMFLVVKGRFRMDFRDRQVWIDEGEFIVVPRGVEHRPVADEECWILLFEPATTLNTGNVVNERTLRQLERV
jgi:mannose-6-phosphate isomerase-like protein (cupin superfamily)